MTNKHSSLADALTRILFTLISPRAKALRLVFVLTSLVTLALVAWPTLAAKSPNNLNEVSALCFPLLVIA